MNIKSSKINRNFIEINGKNLFFKSLRPLKYDNLLRIGSKSDGGYIIPKSSIEEMTNYLNLGVGTEFSFEKDLKNLNNDVKISSFDDRVSMYFFSLWCIRGIIKLILFKINLKELFYRIKTTLYFFQFYKLKRETLLQN